MENSLPSAWVADDAAEVDPASSTHFLNGADLRGKSRGLLKRRCSGSFSSCWPLSWSLQRRASSTANASMACGDTSATRHDQVSRCKAKILVKTSKVTGRPYVAHLHHYFSRTEISHEQQLTIESSQHNGPVRFRGEARQQGN